MKIYHYDQHTGEYLGEGQADDNPLDPSNPLIPAFATATAPPAPADGSARCFTGGAWTDTEDNRGTVVYNIATKGHAVVDVLGPIPSGHTLLAPFPDCKWDGEKWVMDPVVVAAKEAEAAWAAARMQAIADNLPSWSQVDAAVTAISSLAEAKAFIRKLSRVVYWLAKGTQD